MRTATVVLALLLTACSSADRTTATGSPSALLPTTPAPAATLSPALSPALSPTLSPTAAQPATKPSPTASPAARRTVGATASRSPSPIASPKPSLTRAAKTYAIDMVSGNHFSPDALTLRGGDAVLVTNRDRVPHDFTIEELGVGSRTMHQGDTFGYRFQAPGTYTFVCTIHPGMDGTLTVNR